MLNCSQSCDCEQDNDRTLSLFVDCKGGDVNESILTGELDLILSDDELIEHLTELTIRNTSLTRVPLSVCQLTNLEYLYLDDNRLGRLPDSCFTNMTKLRKLAAPGNNITELQDGLFDGLISLHRIVNERKIRSVE